MVAKNTNPDRGVYLVVYDQSRTYGGPWWEKPLNVFTNAVSWVAKKTVDEEAVYHSGIRVGTSEYFYGEKDGILDNTKLDIDMLEKKFKTGTVKNEDQLNENLKKEYFNGHPVIEIHKQGTTTKTDQDIEEFNNGLKESEFTGKEYDWLTYNCNRYSEQLSKLLTGNSIPERILMQGPSWVKTFRPGGDKALAEPVGIFGSFGSFSTKTEK